MPSLAKILGLLALAATIVPPLLFMFKLLPLDAVKWIMLGATVVWFATAPLWMKTDEP
jgi:hypothetical protein